MQAYYKYSFSNRIKSCKNMQISMVRQFSSALTSSLKQELSSYFLS